MTVLLIVEPDELCRDCGGALPSAAEQERGLCAECLTDSIIHRFTTGD